MTHDLRAPTTLGRTGLSVGRLGVGSSYGVPAAALERAFHEHGVNYFYWGALRRGGMKQAIRNLASERERFVVALQTYDRTGPLMALTVERGLKALRIERADVLILGWHDRAPAGRIVDAALELKHRGKVRFLALSSHHRPLFADLAEADEQPIDVFMCRYNAAHRGAETEVFPNLGEPSPGVTAYTATRWGQLLKPAKMPPDTEPLSGADCYRFALSHPAVDLVICGPKNAEQLEEACRALDLGPMNDNELDRARRIGDFVHG